MSIQQVKDYLTLVRFPNLFTLPSNVFAGYFSTHTHNVIETNTIILLILISTCLYAAGVIFNDVADRKTDRRERPNRPIPSGKITRRNAIILGSLLVFMSIPISYFISIATFTVTLVLIGIIFLYNFVVKNSLLGPAAMGSTRALNVILGSSPNLDNFVVEQLDYVFYRINLVCISEFIYILGISALSRHEIHKNVKFRPILLYASIFLSPIIIGIYAAATGIFNDNIWIYLFIFGSFILFMLRVTLFSKSAMSNMALQKAISLLIVGIILHDSVYIGGSLDIW